MAINSFAYNDEPNQLTNNFMRTSLSLASVQTPIIPVVGEWTRNNPGTLSLGQGMVSYPPPESALQAISRFGSQAGQHLYGPSLGHPQLLELITEKLRTENRIKLSDGYSVMVTAGSNMAFLSILMAITDPGAEIILPLPYYFNQEMAIRMLNCTPVPVSTDENYQLDLDALRAAITEKTCAIVTISPNNPSGAVYPEADLRAVNDLCKEHGLYHISDEAYEYFTYQDAKHYSAASQPGSAAHTISLYSLSKAYGFASWRIGYVVFPNALLPGLLKVQDTNLICPPLITQIAAMGALQTGSAYCKAQLAKLFEIRKQVMQPFQAVPELGRISAGDGAFYLLLNLHTEKTDLDIVRSLIEGFQVAVIPGSAFGMQSGCAVRISYGMLNPELTNTAIGRLLTGLKAVC